MIPAEILISFAIFAYIAAITPGPANLTSLATSIQYGKKAAFRQWLGLLAGYAIDCFISGMLVFFVGTALNKYVKWFSFVGAAYLIYLTVHMLIETFRPASTENSTEEDAGKAKVSQPGILRGILVQLTNVKVLLTLSTSLSSYILPYSQNLGVILLFAFLLIFTGPPCNLVWLFAGLSLQKLFAKHQKLINLIMAISLFACAVSLFIVPFTL